jgi:hypothetical protein
MSYAGDELDESQLTAMDLPLEFKVNKYSIFIVCVRRLYGPLIHEITIIICHHHIADHKNFSLGSLPSSPVFLVGNS